MMASENSKRLQLALVPALKQRGFKKAGPTWRKASDEAIGLLNVQGSQWGPSFYIKLGVYFRALGDSDRPTEHHCHLRTRLIDLVTDRERLNGLLDFDKPVQEEVRVRELETLVIEHALPWPDAVSTVEGARRYCNTQAPNSSLVTKEAREFLRTTLVPIWRKAD
jgi:hypothetical protein